MIKAVTREELYDYRGFCSKCSKYLLYNSEDIIRGLAIDHIICPECGERIYV